MKKFFKRVGKVAGMVVLYLLIAVGTAAGIIFLSPAEVKEDASATEIPAQLLSIVERFKSAKALDINLDAEIDTGAKNIKIRVDGQLDLSGGFSDLKADGNISLDLDDQKFDIKIAYDGTHIFVQLFNGKFCMETDNIMEAVTKITGLLGVSMPSLDGVDLAGMDINMILGMLSDLTETINGNTSTIVINVPVVGALTIVCDLDYSLKSISLPRTDISGMGLRLSANIDYPQNIEIVQPAQEEFIEVTELLDIATAVIDTISADNFAFDVDVAANDFAIGGTINVDASNKKAMFETIILDLPLKVSFVDDVFYLEYGNIYLKFALSDLDQVAALLEKHFDKSLPMEKIAVILSCLKEGNFATLIGGLGLGDASLDSVDLSVLQSLTHQGDKFVISLRDIGEIDILLTENKFKEVSFEGNSLNINLSTTQAKEINVSSQKHADIAQVIPAVDAVLQTIEQDYISGTAQINIGLTNFVANFAYAKTENGIQAQVEANILGKQLVLNYQNEMFFLEFAGLKICGSLEEIGDVLKMIVSVAGAEDSQSVVDTVKQMLDSNNYARFISLEDTENGLKIGLLDKIFATIKYDTLLNEVVVESEKIDADIQLSYKKVEIDKYDVADFMHISEVAEEVEGLYNYIKQQKYYLDITATYKDFALTGALNFDEDGLRAQIVISAFEQTAIINIIGDDVYFDIKDLHVECNFEDLKTLIGSIFAKFETTELPENILESVSLEQLLENIQIHCNEEGLFVDGQDLFAQIRFVGNAPSSLNVNYKDFVFTADIKNTARAITPIQDSEKYVPLSDFVDKALWLVDYVQSGEYYADVKVEIDEDVCLTGKVNYNTDGFSADIKLNAKGLEASVKVVDEVVYIDFKDLHVSFAFTELDALAEFLKQQLNVDIKAELEGLKDVKDVDIAGILTALALGYKNNSLQFSFKDITANINFDKEKLKSVVITYKDITVTVTRVDEATNVEKPNNEYTCATEILTKAATLMSYVDAGKYYAKIEANVQGIEIKGAINYDTNGLSAILKAEYKGIEASIRVFDKEVYVDVKDIHICASLDELDSLMAFLEDTFGIEIDAKSLEEKSKADIIFAVLKELEIGYANDILSAKYNDITAKVFFEEDNLQKAEIGYKDIFATVTKLDEATEIDKSADEKIYTPMQDLLGKISDVYKYITGNEYYVTISGNYKDISITGAVNYVGGKLSAEIKVVAYEQTATIKIFDKLLYVDFKGIHILLDLDDLDDIMAKIKDKFGFDIKEKLQSVNQDTKIEEIIAEMLLGYKDGLLTAGYKGVEASVNFVGDRLEKIVVSYGELFAEITRKNEAQDVTALDEEVTYVSALDLIDKAGEVYSYIKNNIFYIKLEADLGFKVLGHVNYDVDGFSASLSATIDGLSIKAYLLDNVVYLDVDNLKLKFNLGDIENVLQYIKDEFNKDLLTKYNEIKDKLNGLKDSTDIDIGSLDIKQLLSDLQISLSDSNLDIMLPQLSAFVTFSESDMIQSVKIQAEGIDATATVDKKETVSVEGDYFDVMDVLPFVTSIKSYVMGKKYNLTADAEVYEGLTQIYDAKRIVLQVDITDTLKFYGDAKVTGVDGTKAAGFDLNLNLSIFENYLYVNYNGLKLKINTSGLQGLLTMVCEILGIDPSMVSFITGEESGDSGLDGSVVNKLLPKLDTSNPLSMISIIKSFKVKGNTLDISLDGSFISSAERAEYMDIQIVLDGQNLSKLVIKNLYTGVTNNEHFNLVINFKELKTMTKPDTSLKYIDLSGAEDLIAAVINTATHKTFELTGKLKVDLTFTIVKQYHVTWDIPVKIQLKLVDNKPQIYAEIGVIPVPKVAELIMINNDTPWILPTVNNRMLYIYYKDEFVYFYRHEDRGSKQEKGSYEKKLKAHVDTVLDDPIYYLQWGTGFSDLIIDAIRKSLEIEHTVDLGNIINSFDLPNDNNPHYTLSLNMKEITGDKNMGDMSIGIELADFKKQLDDGKTVEQKVIGSLNFGLNMPFADAVQLDLKTTNDNSQDMNLTLDKDLDFTSFDEFINNYTYPENEEWDAEKGEWKKAAEREFTVTFQTNVDGLTAENVTGKIGQTFTLPNYTQNHVVGQKQSGTDYTIYKFAGWYTDANFAAGTEFTTGKIPRYNVTLYAKWEVVEAWRTMTFMYNGKVLGTQYGDYIAGTELVDIETLNQKSEIEEKNGIYLYKKRFKGWQDDQGIPLTVIPNESTTLYANYETYETLIEYTLSFDTGVGEKLDPIKVYGGEEAKGTFRDYGKEDIVIYDSGATTTYHFAGWFTDQAFELPFNDIMPHCDQTLYAKWDIVSVVYEWQLKIYDDEQLLVDTKLQTGTKIVQDASLTQDMVYALPETVRISDTTKWYLDAGFAQETFLPDEMPNNDLTLYVRNKYHVEYTYYELVNNVHTKKTFKADMYQGETFELLGQQNYYIDTKRANSDWLDYRTTYTFAGYNYAPFSLSGKTARVDNQDMIFSSIVNISKQNWYYITFDVTFVKPSAWLFDYSIVESPKPISEVAILDGETFTPSNYTRTCVCRYVIKYNFKILSWSLTNCQNASDGATNIHGYDTLQPFAVHSDTKLYAIWGK